jgi:UDP-hydrolysing UDP-N-acetyl-D-glucosamine 2-epimerase
MTRRIGVVTSARSDYGIYRPVLHAVSACADLQLGLYVTGSHLLPEFGLTVRDIEADGFPIVERVTVAGATDSPAATARAMGETTLGFAAAFARNAPDILVVLGDRFEMHAAAVAAVPFGMPIAHIHGGELSFGAIDEVLRHSMTKMAHLHFAATAEYGRRIVQMGEEPWRVVVSGAPSLDNLQQMDLPSAEEIEARFGLSLNPAPLLVTFHATTREYESAGDQARILAAALERAGRPVIFTAPNPDMGGRDIDAVIHDYIKRVGQAVRVETFGTRNYFGVLRHAAAVVGNSSSALIEAPAFKLPAINIGRRQEGRTRAANVIDVPCDADAIAAAIERAVSPDFRRSLDRLENPYGGGGAAQRIVETLRSVALDERLRSKRFHDLG